MTLTTSWTSAVETEEVEVVCETEEVEIECETEEVEVVRETEEVQIVCETEEVEVVREMVEVEVGCETEWVEVVCETEEVEVVSETEDVEVACGKYDVEVVREIAKVGYNDSWLKLLRKCIYSVLLINELFYSNFLLISHSFKGTNCPETYWIVANQTSSNNSTILIKKSHSFILFIVLQALTVIGFKLY